MKLRIVTPLDVPVDEDGVTALRAEDPSGSFGILQGHADFLTCLVTGVVRWTGQDGAPPPASAAGAGGQPGDRPAGRVCRCRR